MKKGKRLLGIAAAGLIGAGSLFSGAAVTGIFQQTSVYAETGKQIVLATNNKNGWYNESGWKYYKNGKAYTGWHWMSKAEGEKTAHWSYFGNDGKIYTGWRKMGKAEGEKTEHWSYFGNNGWLRTGWQQMGKGTNNPDGNTAKHWSYFGDNGWLRTGWVQLGTGTSNPDGNTAKHWSYFGDNGWLRTGWVQLGKGTSNPDGNTAKHWSYFGGNGWLRTGWVQLGKGTSEPDGNSAKHWSYFGDNGWLRIGLQNMGKGTNNPDGNSAKHLSFFGDNGWLRVNQNVTANGKKYKADAKGWLNVLHDEDEVFMNYLRSEYKNAKGYVNGYPALEKYGDDYGTILKKYAMADFDGDGRNELVVISEDNFSMGTMISMYERNGNGVEDAAPAIPLSQKADKAKLTFYNNAVIVSANSRIFNEYKGDMFEAEGYCVFNNEIRRALDMEGGANGTLYGLIHYEKSSHSSDDMKRYIFAQDVMIFNMSKAQYEKEMKLLTSGKKMDVTLKDVNAKNLNI